MSKKGKDKMWNELWLQQDPQITWKKDMSVNEWSGALKIKTNVWNSNLAQYIKLLQHGSPVLGLTKRYNENVSFWTVN